MNRKMTWITKESKHLRTTTRPLISRS
uniref:Uncharacterized protein n=1 Tax=Rhizophora mucronata TaxID=61149 RepID=A0A2P2QJX8_RHIMU